MADAARHRGDLRRALSSGSPNPTTGWNPRLRGRPVPDVPLGSSFPFIPFGVVFSWVVFLPPTLVPEFAGRAAWVSFLLHRASLVSFEREQLSVTVIMWVAGKLPEEKKMG